MATIRKRGASWQAIVDRENVYKAKSFPTKAMASAWANQLEADIVSGKHGLVADRTLGELLQKYSEEKSIGKEGARWEQIRIAMYVREFPTAMAVKLAKLTSTHFAELRDKRLKTVSGETVRREFNVLSKAINTAVKEWKWLPANPMKGVDRPPPNEPRDRRILADEIERLMYALGYEYENAPATHSARIGAMFLFALESAMRCKEMCILRWDYINWEERTALVPKKTVTHTKTGGREVPLTSEAIRILRQLEKAKDGDLVFRLKESQVDALFRKGRDNALIKDLHFHDTKHEALTRLAEKMSPYDLARMVGTRNLKLMMIYYNKSAADIAKGLD